VVVHDDADRLAPFALQSHENTFPRDRTIR
jgi:hypothetical protein